MRRRRGGGGSETMCSTTFLRCFRMLFGLKSGALWSTHVYLLPRSVMPQLRAGDLTQQRAMRYEAAIHPCRVLCGGSASRLPKVVHQLDFLWAAAGHAPRSGREESVVVHLHVDRREVRRASPAHMRKRRM